MAKIVNNPLKVDKLKGFNFFPGYPAYFSYYLTIIEDKDFIDYAKESIENSSYCISFSLRPNEKLNLELKKKILHGINLLKENFKDINFKNRMLCYKIIVF